MIEDPFDRLAELQQPSGRQAAVKQLKIGSDVEIAGRVHADLEAEFDLVVYAEGAFYRYVGTHWSPLDDQLLRLSVHSYDGAEFITPGGDDSAVKLSKSRINSVLHEMAAIAAKTDFFSDPPIGINCASGFIRFSKRGEPRLEPHDPGHRCRHVLPGRWDREVYSGPPPGSLLERLLGGAFKGDEDAVLKIQLLAQIAGVTALGIATRLKQPKAIVLKGETAENGKSQILDLTRALLPESAIRSITPARMGERDFVVKLAGGLLNASDELSSSGAVASDMFKSVVTGDMITARDLYKSSVEFRPIAQNIFATNALPPFKGGMDRGVQRRLLVITFNRVIPMDERIEGIGQRIGEEEADELLAWAVSGAAEVLRKGAFSIPRSSDVALRDWLHDADPVIAWLEEKVATSEAVDHSVSIRTRDAFGRFQKWAESQGYREAELPRINQFTQRVRANARAVEYKRQADGAVFVGMRIIDEFSRSAGGSTTSTSFAESTLPPPRHQRRL